MPTSDDDTPNLRILLIQMAPLLGDLIRRALESRAGFEILVMDALTPPDLAPDVVILGPGADCDAQRALLQRFPKARGLALAADLRRVRGPGAQDERELTLAALLELVRG